MAPGPATLVCHGAADPHVPLTHVARFTGEMNHAEPDWQLIIYGGAQDGFTHDVPSSTQVPGAESQWISGCLTGPSALSGYHAQGLVVSCIRHRKDHSRRHPTRRCRRTEAGRPLRSDGARNVRRRACRHPHGGAPRAPIAPYPGSARDRHVDLLLASLPTVSGELRVRGAVPAPGRGRVRVTRGPRPLGRYCTPPNWLPPAGRAPSITSPG